MIGQTYHFCRLRALAFVALALAFLARSNASPLTRLVSTTLTKERRSQSDALSALTEATDVILPAG